MWKARALARASHQIPPGFDTRILFRVFSFLFGSDALVNDDPLEDHGPPQPEGHVERENTLPPVFRFGR